MALIIGVHRGPPVPCLNCARPIAHGQRIYTEAVVIGPMCSEDCLDEYTDKILRRE